MKLAINALLAGLALAGFVEAQGRFAHGTGTAAAASTLNMAQSQTVSGTVSAVNIGFGMQYPTVTIGKVQIKIAPVWYLLENDFEIKVGDTLSIVAVPSNLATDPYLYAIDITNTATTQRVLLRDAAGLPLWSGRQAPSSASTPATCLTGAAANTASGTVEQLNSGIGIQMPTLTLKLADASLLTVKLGPERTLLSSGLELKIGDPVTLTYVASCSGELVALSVTNAAGTVVLRDTTGRPAWN